MAATFLLMSFVPVSGALNICSSLHYHYWDDLDHNGKLLDDIATI